MKGLGLLLVGVLLSGALLAFALPPHGWAGLGWFVFVPALMALRGKGFAFGFGSGVLISLVAAYIDKSGFLVAAGVEDGTPDWIFAGFLLFGVIAGIAMGLWSASDRMREGPWVLTAWAVLFEAALLIYLPAHMALTQSRSTAMLELASWTGVWGVSYLVWLANFAIAGAPIKHKVMFVVAGVLLSVSWLPAEQGALSIAMIQTRSSDEDLLKKLNLEAGKSGALLSVWPELSGQVMAAGGRTEDLQRVARTAGQPPYITTYEEPADPMPFNVARIVSDTGMSEPYQKRKPFAGERQMHAAGSTPVAATVGNVTYGMNICFDSCFPAIMRDTARLPNVGIILLPTLDPDTPYGITQSLHAAYTPFRAAELGVPIIRSDITAHSMAVDSHGRVVAELGNESDQVLIANVQAGKRWTFVTMAGDWFLAVCALIAFAGLRKGKPDASQDSKE